MNSKVRSTKLNIPSRLSGVTNTIFTNDMRSQHVLLLPSFLLLEPTNRDLFFHFDVISKLIKQLTHLGVVCLVLDWQHDTTKAQPAMSEWPEYLTSYTLDKQAYFKIHRVAAKNFATEANWQAVVEEVMHCFLRHSPQTLYHFHNASPYLRQSKPAFKSLQDNLVLPEKEPCKNGESLALERCRATDQLAQALLHYLEMLCDIIQKEKAELQMQRIQQRREFNERYRQEQSFQIVKVVDVGCGFCKRQKEVITTREYQPLYVDEQKSKKEVNAKATSRLAAKRSAAKLIDQSMQFASLSSKFSMSGG